MSKKKLIIATVFLFIVCSGIILSINNSPSKAIFYNGHRYINQNIIVPYKYLDGKIGSKDGYVYWAIVDTNEDYYLAVKEDINYYLYKTKDANDITFVE